MENIVITNNEPTYVYKPYQLYEEIATRYPRIFGKTAISISPESFYWITWFSARSAASAILDEIKASGKFTPDQYETIRAICANTVTD